MKFRNYILWLIFLTFSCTTFILFTLENWLQTTTRHWTEYFSYYLSVEKARCPIYTYYEPLINSLDSTSSLQILEIWGYAFYAHGFWPIILNRTFAQSRSNFDEMLKRFSQLPTVNSVDYELNCYLRWLALAEQGGGLLMDYDILPMISSRDSRIRELKMCIWGHLTSYQSQIPMIVHGNRSEIEKWIEYMVSFTLNNETIYEGKPHISDMGMAQRASIQQPNLFIRKLALPFFHYSYNQRHTLFAQMKSPTPEIMTRIQHIYYFVHHVFYVPIEISVSPYSTEIVRRLSLCPDVIPTDDDLDFLCASESVASDICKLIIPNGYWSPNSPELSKCTWKNTHPPSSSEWGISSSNLIPREPFLIAILPTPDLYLWRLWLHESSLHWKNETFERWSLRQSNCLMLDTLIPQTKTKLNVDTRIKRTINAMQTGQALIITEKFLAQLYKSRGKTEIEKWIGAHLGFLITLPQPKNDWQSERVIDINPTLVEEDYRFYSAVDQENKHWTTNWNQWKTNFLRDQ